VSKIEGNKPLYTSHSEAPTPLTPIIEVLRGGADVIDIIADEWRELCNNGPSDQPYYRPEWIAAYVRNFSQDTGIVIFLVRVSGRLAAVLPLLEEKCSIARLPVTKLKGMSTVNLWRYDMVRADGEEGRLAVSALWNHLRKYSGWDVIEFPNLPQGAAAEELLRAARACGHPTKYREYMQNPIMSLAGWDGKREPLEYAQSSNLRHTLRRILNKIESEGGLLLHRTSEAKYLDRYFEIEKLSWKNRESSTLMGNEKWKNFYREIAMSAERFGYLSLYFLEFRGQTIAARIAFTYRGRYFDMECAHDGRFDQYAPGHLIVHEILRDCARRGFYEIDLSGHMSEWKRRWTSQSIPHAYGYIYSRRFYGHILHFAGHTLRPLARRILGRDFNV
jgi:CelD/BcsL family acetyltransferase involved in cellulose biosynthesis